MTDINVLQQQLAQAEGALTQARAEAEVVNARLTQAATMHSALFSDYVRRTHGAVKRVMPKLLPSIDLLEMACGEFVAELDLRSLLVDPDSNVNPVTAREFVMHMGDLVEPVEGVEHALSQMAGAFGPNNKVADSIKKAQAHAAAFKSAVHAARQMPSRKHRNAIDTALAALTEALSATVSAAKADVLKRGHRLIERKERRAKSQD
jgi:hypothetical protein